MSCHEPNEQNEVGDDEGEEYEEESEALEYVAKEFQLFDNRYMVNSEQTETMNLGDEECVKEVKISVHLNESQKRDMIVLHAKYIHVFV